jgi:4-carboxymuconolactone decarboxylase
MRIPCIRILVAALVLSFRMPTRSEAKTMENAIPLNEKQQRIVAIAAFTASGELDRLKPALHEGLETGLTINEIKEILVQMYAYAGFPRSLNGISALMEVLDERKGKGIEDEMGRDASPLPKDMDKDSYGAEVRMKLAGLDEMSPPAKWQTFAPLIDTFLKEHLFADMFARDVLDHQCRELATIAALSNMTGTAAQLRFHFGAAMNVGLSAVQLRACIGVLDSRIGKEEAQAAGEVLMSVLG